MFIAYYNGMYSVRKSTNQSDPMTTAYLFTHFNLRFKLFIGIGLRANLDVLLPEYLPTISSKNKHKKNKIEAEKYNIQSMFKKLFILLKPVQLVAYVNPFG